MQEKDILSLIEKDPWMMEILIAVREIDLPDWWIGAGFVRSKVWDFLHGYRARTLIPDIDVIYFDLKNATEDHEKEFEKMLKDKNPDVSWSVKNQARMHTLHNHAPYKNATEGLSHWVETATCIGVKLDKNNSFILAAPHGVDDLVNLILRPTENIPEELKKFKERVRSKKWLEKWPKLRIVIP